MKRQDSFPKETEYEVAKAGIHGQFEERNMTQKWGLCDADIRPALRLWLMAKYACESNTVILEELGICRGQVRVDLAVVNGVLHGYEIKSDRDSLRRLEGQADVYSKVLDRATIVVGKKHISNVLELIPNWWEILQVDSKSSNPRFKTIRRGLKNPERDSRSLAELLWLDDAVALLEQRDAARGIRGKPRRVVWDRVCEILTVDEIAIAVREHLKSRAMPTMLPQQLQCDG